MTDQIQTSSALVAIETRPLGPGDRALLAGFFTHLGPESRYRRFFGPKHELTPRELDWLTAIDHVNHEAIVAVDRRDGSIEFVNQQLRTYTGLGQESLHGHLWAAAIHPDDLPRVEADWRAHRASGAVHCG